MKKIVLQILGLISFGLAIIGVFLPLLPTTPFLLLSSYLFLKSSDRLYNWLINHPYFGKYILDFQENKSIPLRVKVSSIFLLWLTIGFSAVFVISLLWVRILLLVIAISVSVHILQYKTK